MALLEKSVPSHPSHLKSDILFHEISVQLVMTEKASRLPSLGHPQITLHDIVDALTLASRNRQPWMAAVSTEALC